MNIEMQNKKRWLDKLYYKIGNLNCDFFVCGTYEKNGKRGFTKWKKYLDCVAIIDVVNDTHDWKDGKFFEQINQRQILPNEIVLDIEDPEKLKPIINQMKKWGWEDWFVYSTGSRGYHIHIFSKDLTELEKESVVKKFDTDIQKCSEKNLIALENCPHWKTGKLKELIEYG